MNVRNLIAALSALPPDAEVDMVWDSAMRSTVSFVWLARSGIVALAPYNETVDGDDCPVGHVGAEYSTPQDGDDPATTRT
mgnify:CR=1 FL=1